MVHPGSELPLWVKAMLNIGCKSKKRTFSHFEVATTHKQSCCQFPLKKTFPFHPQHKVMKMHLRSTKRLVRGKVRTGACVLAGTKAPKLLLLSLILRALSPI